MSAPAKKPKPRTRRTATGEPLPKPAVRKAIPRKPRLTAEDKADLAAALAVMNDPDEEYTPLDDVARRLGLRK